jgi:hypothetical protein
MKTTTATLEKLLNRVPKFMHPELDRVENLADLDFQIQHEIDLALDGEVKWTKTQLHRAKMFYADVHIAAQEFARDYPELVDDLNHAVTPALEDPSATWGWVTGEHEITPIEVGKDGKWVTAEIHEGQYIGTDGQERHESGIVCGIDSGKCFKVFGECYPFGSQSGANIAYYLQHGATIRLRSGV